MAEWKPSGNLLGKAYMEVRKKLQFEEQQENRHWKKH